MKLVDLTAQQEQIRDKIETNMNTVLAHGKYIMGPEIKELEHVLAEFVGVKHAISCSSGTDALFLSLLALGVGTGDMIITTPFTFIATAEVIALLGAIPVFADIDPDTFNIDPDKVEAAVRAVLNSDPSLNPLPENRHGASIAPQALKGIITVDLFGLPAAYRHINAIASEHDLFVIEDAAQAFGAEYNGRKTCSLSDIGCTSFFPTKPLGCYGDGGMCFTDHDDLAVLMRSIRGHGMGGHKYDNVRIGLNCRMDTLQAAILLAKFGIFPEEIALRQKIAGRYSEKSSGILTISTPTIHRELKSVWAHYSLLAKDKHHRSILMSRLKDAGIPTGIYYPKPLHLQRVFSEFGYRKGSFPVSEDVASRIFSIPMHPYVKEEDQDKIVRLLQT